MSEAPVLVAREGFLMTDYVTNFVLEEQRIATQAAAFAETPEAGGLQAVRPGSNRCWWAPR